MGIRSKWGSRQPLIDWVAALAQTLSRESFDLAMTIIWGIWTECNNLLWKGKALNSLELHCKLQTWLTEFHKWIDKAKTTRAATVQPWHAWVKCNFDAAWDEGTETGGIGGRIT